jgi:hypothetical protein
MQIWQIWHFCNNGSMHDKWNKLFLNNLEITYIVNYLQHKFKTVYTPKQELSLDKGIIPRRGRLSFRTYNPAKVTKYGILVRMLCEGTTGYIYDFKVYSDAGTKLQDTVLSILLVFVGSHHHIYMNNYYNSVKTAEFLPQKNMRFYGIIRANKGFP